MTVITHLVRGLLVFLPLAAIHKGIHGAKPANPPMELSDNTSSLSKETPSLAPQDQDPLRSLSSTDEGSMRFTAIP
jgi:hypothetical protein